MRGPAHPIRALRARRARRISAGHAPGRPVSAEIRTSLAQTPNSPAAFAETIDGSRSCRGLAAHRDFETPVGGPPPSGWATCASARGVRVNGPTFLVSAERVASLGDAGMWRKDT